MLDARRMTEITAKAVAALYLSRRSDAKEDERGKNSNRATVTDRRYRGLTANDVLVCSTGRIGVSMPMKNVERGIRACATLLRRSTINAQGLL